MQEAGSGGERVDDRQTTMFGKASLKHMADKTIVIEMGKVWIEAEIDVSAESGVNQKVLQDVGVGSVRGIVSHAWTLPLQVDSVTGFDLLAV